jgi:hypothetical protein
MLIVPRVERTHARSSWNRFPAAVHVPPVDVFRLSSSRRTTAYGNNLPCLVNRTEYKFLALHEAFVRHT